MPEIVLIGAGNVGTQLGRRFHACDLSVVQVYSRRLEKAEALARQIDARATDQWSAIQTDADLYILAVPDDAIAGVAGQLRPVLKEQALVVHTSGATPTEALQAFPRRGVFYPLQTFSQDRTADFSNIPICVSASHPADEDQLEQLARTIGPKVYRIDDRKRAVLHVAAVFANNFANHCFQISYEILERENLPFELLQPLIQETARKIISRVPADMQTGPAKRGDEATIRRHLDYLERTNSPYREIYRQLSDNIQQQNNNDRRRGDGFWITSPHDN